MDEILELGKLPLSPERFLALPVLSSTWIFGCILSVQSASLIYATPPSRNSVYITKDMVLIKYCAQRKGYEEVAAMIVPNHGGGWDALH